MPDDRHAIQAPARVFDSPKPLRVAFSAGELNYDLVCWQGPQANSMPEWRKLTRPLAMLQGKDYRIALETNGRMSGAWAVQFLPACAATHWPPKMALAAVCAPASAISP